MKKTDSICIRLKDSEKAQLESAAEKRNISLSNFIRMKLFDGNDNTCSVKPEAIPILGEISTEINKYHYDNDNTHISVIEGKIEELWPILLK